MDNLLPEQTAAAHLGVSTKTVRAWRFEQKGPPYVKLGHGKKAAVRYRPADLEAFIQQGQVSPCR